MRRPKREVVDEYRQRFQREARTAIKLRHPGVAQLYDFMVEPGGAAGVNMEYIDGVAVDRALEA